MIIILALLYFSFRLFHLTSLPIFTDEAIYIRWAQTGLSDPMYRFMSLLDGKQPLFTWAMYPFLKLVDDPLVAGRLVSVFSGFLTMLGLGALSYLLFRKRSWAFLTMLLYIAFPFAQVHDRMALYDSMVGMLFVWTIFASILLVNHLKLSSAYHLGVVLGLQNLTKLPPFLSILLLPLTLFLFNFRQKHWKKELAKWAGYSAIAVFLSTVMSAIVRLSPLPNVTAEKNNTFFFPISEWIKDPFITIDTNLAAMVGPFISYLTIPYLVLLIIAIVYLKKDMTKKLLLLSYFIVPFVGFAFLGKVIFLRYLFFMSLPLIVLAGWGLGQLIDMMVVKYKIRGNSRFGMAGLLAFIVLLYPAYVSLSFAKDPIHSQIPESDRTQYATAWTSGWGLSESVSYLQKQAESGPIFVATAGGFGLYPQGIELYLVTNPNIAIKGYYQEITNDLPTEVADKAKQMPTYFIFYQPCPNNLCPRPGDAPTGWPVRAVQTYQKPDTLTRVVIYQVQSSAIETNAKNK